jgi:hypothetical protein
VRGGRRHCYWCGERSVLILLKGIKPCKKCITVNNLSRCDLLPRPCKDSSFQSDALGTLRSRFGPFVVRRHSGKVVWHGVSIGLLRRLVHAGVT